jgi:hypothetical protein
VPCWPILHWHILPGPAVRLNLSIYRLCDMLVKKGTTVLQTWGSKC